MITLPILQRHQSWQGGRGAVSHDQSQPRVWAKMHHRMPIEDAIQEPFMRASTGAAVDRSGKTIGKITMKAAIAAMARLVTEWSKRCGISKGKCQ